MSEDTILNCAFNLVRDKIPNENCLDIKEIEIEAKKFIDKNKPNFEGDEIFLFTACLNMFINHLTIKEKANNKNVS